MMWKDDLLWKLSNIIRWSRLVQYIRASFGNSNFRVYLGNRKSKTQILNNGLSQGSVLAPIFFNVNTHEIPFTESKMFSYADEL